MTVFMGPRTKYKVWRYELHSKMCWVVLICGIVCGGVIAEKPVERGSVAGGALAVAMVSKKGRGTVGRLVRETFYGCLFSFTGVFGNRGDYGQKG